MSYLSLISDLESSAVFPAQPASGPTGLSAEQALALGSPFGQGAVICAGAGAGKTKLLVERAAALLKSGASPDRVAVVAFTRKSAAEIQNRIKLKLGRVTQLPTCSTIDALAYASVAQSGVAIVLATTEQQAGCLQEVRALMPADMEKLSDDELLMLINRAREDSDTRSVRGLLGLAYEDSLKAAGLWDFTMLLTEACKIEGNRFDYVIVDESQDLSWLQLLFLQTIAKSARFWFIGDPDQSIYSFRGAHSDMMEHLRSLVPNIYLLTTNYRSAREVVARANGLIRHNPRTFPVAWTAARELDGVVRTSTFSDLQAEVEDTVAWLTASPRTRCVLARTQARVAPYKALELPGYTVHEAKGLEWPEVRVLGCEEGLFPHPLSGAQEERRLFYVAMTRARDMLELTYCVQQSSMSRKQKKPSRFLVETEL